MSERPLGGRARGSASMVSGPACTPCAEWVLGGRQLALWPCPWGSLVGPYAFRGACPPPAADFHPCLLL